MTELNNEEIDDSLEEGAPVMQFTGLLDNNSDPIYEGDIVRIHRGAGSHAYSLNDPNHYRRIVKYDHYHAAFELYQIDGKRQSAGVTLCEGNAKAGYFEIIGNIYESPELLEES